MHSRRILFPLIAIVAAVVLWWSSRTANAPSAAARGEHLRTVTTPPATSPAGITAASAPAAAQPVDMADEFPLAASLNAAGSTIARDLDAVSRILDAWRTSFPHEGNPVGENHEITAALLGHNRLELALLPKNHPAINAQGELCDRWGTPFRFHQLSGERMEIRSAGPDRKFGTSDDALWSPGS